MNDIFDYLTLYTTIRNDISSLCECLICIRIIGDVLHKFSKNFRGNKYKSSDFDCLFYFENQGFIHLGIFFHELFLNNLLNVFLFMQRLFLIQKIMFNCNYLLNTFYNENNYVKFMKSMNLILKKTHLEELHLVSLSFIPRVF